MITRTPQTGVRPRVVHMPQRVGLPRQKWEFTYHGAVRVLDLAMTLALPMVATLSLAGTPLSTGHRWLFPVITALAVVAALLIQHAWEPWVLGQGAEEFRRLGTAVLMAGIVLGLGAFALDVQSMRLWVFGVLPALALLLAIQRYALRRVLHARRNQGECLHPVLAAGSADEVAHLIDRTRAEPYYGWSIEAVCVSDPDQATDSLIRGVPIVGNLDDVAERVRNGGYGVVMIAPNPYWGRAELRQLSWQLEDVPAELVVAPALMDFTGPRLHVTPVYGLTMLRVSKPTFQGPRWLLKGALDRAGALLGLTVLTPLLLLLATAVKLQDGGPVLFRQTRVGRGGKQFSMFKFRSMGVDAARLRAEIDDHNEGSGPLFKMRRDPRVTRLGAVLRRFSLDELPQLVNVLAGNMSLVGPRPPLPDEVLRYESPAHRRLAVRPGLTGLWQVSGRSDLSWEDTVRLDLRYVENWSFALDAVIMWKTVSTVVRGDGAY